MAIRVIALLAAFIVTCPLQAEEAKDSFADVWTFDEYKEQSPERATLTRRFEDVVRSDKPPMAREDIDPVSIVIVYPGNQVSDYWRRSRDALEKRLKEAGLSYRIESIFTKPGTELRQQERFIQKSLAKKPDYLVFTLDALKHRQIIENALARTDTKIILQNITTPVKIWEGNQPFLYVGFDHATGSRQIADWYLEKTGGKGKYGVLYGPRGYVSDMRGKTVVQYFDKTSDLTMVESYFTGFDRARSKAAALDLLQNHPDIKFILACSTDIALGAIDALRETGLLGKVMVNGWGGGSAELESLQDGALDLTVMRMNDDNGVAMADAIVMSENERTKHVPLVYSGDISLIDQTTDQQALDTMKTRAFRYTGSGE